MPSNTAVPPTTFPGGGTSPRSDRHVALFPEPIADKAKCCPALDGERDVADRGDRTEPRLELGPQVLDREEWELHVDTMPSGCRDTGRDTLVANSLSGTPNQCVASMYSRLCKYLLVLLVSHPATRADAP